MFFFVEKFTYRSSQAFFLLNILFYFLSALDTLAHNRSFILTRNAFIGSGKYSAKYLGEYNSDWYNFKRFVIALIEMPMFGFNMVGGDVCGLNGEYEYDLCSNWIKLGGLSPIMRLHFRNFTDVMILAIYLKILKLKNN